MSRTTPFNPAVPTMNSLETEALQASMFEFQMNESDEGVEEACVHEFCAMLLNEKGAHLSSMCHAIVGLALCTESGKPIPADLLPCVALARIALDVLSVRNIQWFPVAQAKDGEQ